jgi:hypothetical protein
VFETPIAQPCFRPSPTFWSSKQEEPPPKLLTGRVEGWRGTEEPVSNLRLDKPSVRISRTRLSLLISSQGL